MPPEYYMRQCLALASRAKGHTAPNPMVGAVLVHNDTIISQGYHHHYGADHAEVDCLNNVASTNKHLIPASTMYVNLEPCAHHGKTPPCAHRLVHEKIKAVAIANPDPFEQVSGRGIEILKQGGVAVTTGILEQEGKWLNRRFFCLHTHKRPYIILKWAQTATGFIAPADRSRFQITSPESTALVHQWRTQEAAIMVGTTTALNDNPQLTARLATGRQPLRIVLDRNLQLPHTHHIFDNAATTWIINERTERQEGNVHFVQLAFGPALLDQLMQRLYNVQICSLIVEGGTELLHSFISAGLWDEARIFTGTKLIADGLVAPMLHDRALAYDTHTGSDSLAIFVRKNSSYPYIQGMEL